MGRKNGKKSYQDYVFDIIEGHYIKIFYVFYFSVAFEAIDNYCLEMFCQPFVASLLRMSAISELLQN